MNFEKNVIGQDVDEFEEDKLRIRENEWIKPISVRHSVVSSYMQKNIFV